MINTANIPIIRADDNKFCLSSLCAKRTPGGDVTTRLNPLKHERCIIKITSNFAQILLLTSM